MESNYRVAAYSIPNIIITSKGTILCFATARIGDNHDWGNVQEVVLSRSIDEGQTWEKTRIIASKENWMVNENSAILVPVKNKIIVFGYMSPRFNELGERISETWAMENPDKIKALGGSHFFIESTDEGITWSEIKKNDFPYSPHDPGISLKYGKHKGRLVLPARTNIGTVFDWDSLYNGVLLSDDFGNSWRAGGLSQSHVGEACVVELSDGSIYLNNRNHDDNFGIRNHAISYDGGETFTKFGYDPQLIEPTCDAGIVRFSEPENDNIILFSNPAVRPSKRWDSQSRVRMSVKASFDDCKTWPIEKLIYSGPSAYSSLAVNPNGTAFLIYERASIIGKDSRENIAIAKFNKAWLEQPNIEPPKFSANEQIFDKEIQITIYSKNNYDIYFTTDGTDPNINSVKYKSAITVNNTTLLRAICIYNNSSSIISERQFVKSKFPIPIYKKPFSPKYSANKELTLVDGFTGGLNFNDGKWQGFEGNDFEVILDLETVKNISEISINFLQSPDFWIFFPSTVTFYISENNFDFRKLERIINYKSLQDINTSIQTFTTKLSNQKGRYIKVNAENLGVCPKWHKGAGGKAWLFTDEIFIN